MSAITIESTPFTYRGITCRVAYWPDNIVGRGYWVGYAEFLELTVGAESWTGTWNDVKYPEPIGVPVAPGLRVLGWDDAGLIRYVEDEAAAVRETQRMVDSLIATTRASEASAEGV